MTIQSLTDHAAELPPGPTEPHELGATDESIHLMLRWFREYGDTYRVYAPAHRAWVWVIHHPDDVKRVMVTNHRNYTKGVGIDRVKLLLGNGIMTSERDFWRRQRRMMQPAFHRKVIERFGSLIRACSEEMLDRWEACAARGEPINITDSMSQMALAVILNALFSEDLGRLVRDLHDNPFMIVTKESKRDPKFAYEYRRLGRVILEIVRERRAAQARHFDFMQMLMEAGDPDTGATMNERELIDEILTLVVAGHETTASALNWTWWLLSHHPEVEARLHEEQDRVGDVGAASYADLDRLPYTMQVIQESMRLYPPGWVLTRRNIGPDRLGGYKVPAGTYIFVSPFVIHRHPKFWERPEAFDPGHFDPARVEARHKLAYLPFGAGPRHCIGENFSLYEMMLHLNGATRRFRLREADNGPVEMEARINLRTAKELYMRVEKR
ncbi:MAG TPA: cytochrome P450 [Steroidobacteraceae bacterium]|nr:cytochrome P450 [Steroidobacteraceae bacterium]